MKHRRHQHGFTLIELLAVVAIIGILSSTILGSFQGARVKALDAKAKQEMKQIQTALEMYNNDYGAYPVTSTWSGYLTTGCGNAGQLTGPLGYIPGLAPKYIKELPADPTRNFGGCNGYLYISLDGKQYKLLRHTTTVNYPSAGEAFYDPVRPTWSWMVCVGNAACNTW